MCTVVQCNKIFHVYSVNMALCINLKPAWMICLPSWSLIIIFNLMKWTKNLQDQQSNIATSPLLFNGSWQTAFGVNKRD